MREIGSEFWEVPIADHDTGLFSKNIQWYQSGRSALQAIVNELQACNTVAMPSWCCESMILPFANAGIKTLFYPVYWDKGLVQQPRFDCDILFIMDYFGYSSKPFSMHDYHGVTIRDVAHSVFSASYNDADYYFGSLRKWFGVWTGGFGWAKDGHHLAIDQTGNKYYIDLRKKAMLQKQQYIAGETNDKHFRELYQIAEEMLDNDICAASGSDRDSRMVKKLDGELIRKRRRANAEVLRLHFSEWLIFDQMEDSDWPLFVPVIVPFGLRDELRLYLIEQGIYCPVHWPVGKLHELDENERYIYDNELSLVCDQRYNEEDMNRICETIEMFMENKK